MLVCEAVVRFIAVDPGANYTGVAVLEEDGTFSEHGEYSSPLDVWQVVRDANEKDPRNTIVIIEDFLGGGSRDKFVTTTLKTLGYIYWRCLECVISAILVPNQARLANVRNVPKEITGKDEIAAAAHALSARERWPRP